MPMEYMVIFTAVKNDKFQLEKMIVFLFLVKT